MKNNYSCALVIIFLNCLFCTIILADVTINPAGGAEFTHIQPGIDFVVAGETVWLVDATYTGVGNIDLDFGGKDITVRSINDDPLACIIDCNGSGRGFIFQTNETSDSIVRGLTVRLGYSDIGGGGIFAMNASPTITNCKFTGNTAVNGGSGGGLALMGSSSITDCTITGNAIVNSGYGGGIALGGSCTVTDCTITGNVTGNNGHGGGIAFSTGSSTVTNCTIIGNTMGDFGTGGGMYFTQSTSTITNCTITGNTIGILGQGGGIAFDYSSGVISNCIISENIAGEYGGGVYCVYSSPTITNCTIAENQTDDRGGGIYCHYDASPTIINCTIADNSTVSYGGGFCVYRADCSPEIVNCILWSNTAANGHEIALLDTSSPASLTISYSDVHGGFSDVYVDPGCALNWGLYNIAFDPLFVEGSPFDYHLTGSSPVIDQGTDAHPDLPVDDIDGDPRPLNSGYDLGSDEIWVTPYIADDFPGTALDFDGIDEYVTTGLNNLRGSEITIEYWFRGASTQSAVRQQDGSGWIVSGWNDLHILSNDGGIGGIAVGAGAEDGEWHHIAITWQQNTTNGFKSYLDGVLVEQRNSSNTPIPNYANNICFGSHNGTSEFMDGKLDEVRIWRVARTIDQIRESMHLTLESYEVGLVGYWQFNDGSGTSALDVAGGNHGTLVNMDDTDWIDSTIPVGGGTCNFQLGVQNQSVTLGNVTIDDTADPYDTAVDLFNTELSLAPNLLPSPGGNNHVLEDRYWVDHGFTVPGTFSAQVTFSLPAAYLDTGDAANLILYNRVFNSDGAWSEMVSGASSVTETTVTFDGIAAFGQFTIGSSGDSPLQEPPLPTTGPVGISILLIILSGILVISSFRRKKGSNLLLTLGKGSPLR